MAIVKTLAIWLGILSVTTGLDCDEYSFCSDPGMTIVEGNYEFGETYNDHSCLAGTKNAQSFSMMVAESSSHINGTVTVNLMTKNNDYGAAVGARLQPTANNIETSVCRGYTGYWCYLNKEDTKGNDYMTATLEMKKCTNTSISSLSVTTTVSETITMDTQQLYKLRFGMVGSELKCGILPYSTASTSDNYLAEIETYDSDYTEGVMGIANWGTSWYYKNSTFCDLPSNPTSTPTEAPTFLPSPTPSFAPSATPTGSPTEVPTPNPSATPSGRPTGLPTALPTMHPTQLPTPHPTSYPTHAPVPDPSPAPTASPSQAPTAEPSTRPSPFPTTTPTVGPTPYPSATPSLVPTPSPTVGPTPYPSATPTLVPSPSPSHAPSEAPTQYPTPLPTPSPSISPTEAPSMYPTHSPTQAPSFPPTKSPTQLPSPSPSAVPSFQPTGSPSFTPSPPPTHFPSQEPTQAPTPLPSGSPTEIPTPTPSGYPSPVPTTPEPSPVPTYVPSHHPTGRPTHLPTPSPTRSPTLHPSGKPTYIPSPLPSETPTSLPSASPSYLPSPNPTHTPTSLPTPQPTFVPTPQPSHLPTSLPTPGPTSQPTLSPTTWEPTPLPTNLPTYSPTTPPTPTPTLGPTPFPSPVPTDVPTYLPTFAPSMSPTTYCYEPEDADVAPVYSYIETIGGDMVSWIYAHYLEIESKADELWQPYTDTDKGQEPSGKTHYTPDNEKHGTVPQMSSFGRTLKSSKEGTELRKLVEGFSAGAHLVNDIQPENENARTTVRKTTADLAQDSRHSFIKAPEGVPVSTAVLMAVAALALGVAFQNQKAWTEMSRSRFSRAEYTALI